MIKEDARFEAFVDQAQGMLGNDLSRDWLFEVWQGADCDPNRALNHVLDSPPDKVRRGGSSKSHATESKPPKKHKPKSEAKNNPPPPSSNWQEEDPFSPPSPPPQHHSPPAQNYAPSSNHQNQFNQAPPPQPPQQPAQYGYPQPPSYQQPPAQQIYPQPVATPGSMFGMPGQYPQMQPYPNQQSFGFPQYPGPTMQAGMTPMVGGFQQPDPSGNMMAGFMAPNPIQQAQAMFVQQQQHQRLMMLKTSLDNVLANPGVCLVSPQIMQNLQDTMIAAMEAPNATLQLAERARQSQQTAQFIQIMQSQIGNMLTDPKVATNPQLLQQLNSQMNQLRMLTMQHVAQQQLDANPATALSLTVPILTPPSPAATMLQRAVTARLNTSPLVADEPVLDDNIAGGDDWWSPRASKEGTLSERNPFKDSDSAPTPRGGLRAARSMASLPASMGTLPFFNSMPSQPVFNPLGSMPSMMYGGQPSGFQFQ